MSALPQIRPPGPELESTGLTPGAALAFSRSLLERQKVPLLARRGAARALALLLERSLERRGEPVFLSAQEGARACGIEPRTWWLVKKRLLSLGHLLATAGGAPPGGRPGGRGRKGAYFVSPETLAAFEETLKERPETLNGLEQTLKTGREERNLSHHRPLRLLLKRTSDVPSLEGDEEPTPEAIWAQVRRERSTRVKLRLLRLLETVLLSEALSSVMEKREETGNAPGKTLKDPARRPRAKSPLWSPASDEERAVFTHVREILSWANRDFGARFDLERSSKDTLLYPFERVRGAVANVLLKRARGFRFENPGAILWDGITLEGYKLDEFSVGPLSEVLERISRKTPPRDRPKVPDSFLPPPAPKREDPSHSRRLLLRSLWEKLSSPEREELDRRAEALAREELGSKGSSLRLELLKHDKRSELLLATPCNANGAEAVPSESQIPVFASNRNETEPNAPQAART